MPIEPIRAGRFPLAIAQGIDVIVPLPPKGGAFPILALRELAAERTGIVLATSGSKIAKLPTSASTASGLAYFGTGKPARRRESALCEAARRNQCFALARQHESL